MFIIIAGNVIDGLWFVGPFDSEDEVTEYADKYIDTDWTMGQLLSKYGFTGEKHAFKCLQCGLGYNMTEDDSEEGCPECGQILLWDTDIPLYDEENPPTNKG